MKKDGREIYTAQIRYATTVGMRDQSWNPPILDYIESIPKEIGKAFETCSTSKKHHVVADDSSQITPVFESITDQIIGGSGMRLTQ